MKLAKPMTTGLDKTFPTMKPEAVKAADVPIYLCVYYCYSCSSCGCWV